MTRRTHVAELVERAREGDARAVARLVSLVEDEAPELPEVMALLAPSGGRARVVGLTGAPGVGKSTATSALVSAYRARGERVGVVAVDPTSPFSGGALLGDRVRMQEHATDPGVYIRSMASRGHLGGLAWSTPQALHVLDGAGCDVVLVETVGVGQSEVEVAGLCDTVVVLLAPGAGDDVQAAKAGILEIGDVYVVNKADRDGADSTVRELRHVVALAPKERDGWRRPVLRTVAATGDGVGELVETLDAHREWAVRTGALDRRRLARAAAEVEAIAVTRLHRRLVSVRRGQRLDELAAEVAAGRLDAHAAADRLLADLVSGDATPTART